MLRAASGAWTPPQASPAPRSANQASVPTNKAQGVAETDATIRLDRGLGMMDYFPIEG